MKAVLTTTIGETDPVAISRCRICRCTESDSCGGGCCWIESGLCSDCAALMIALYDYSLDAGPLSDRECAPNFAAVDRLMLELKRRNATRPLLVLA